MEEWWIGEKDTPRPINLHLKDVVDSKVNEKIPNDDENVLYLNAFAKWIRATPNSSNFKSHSS